MSPDGDAEVTELVRNCYGTVTTPAGAKAASHGLRPPENLKPALSRDAAAELGECPPRAYRVSRASSETACSGVKSRLLWYQSRALPVQALLTAL